MQKKIKSDIFYEGAIFTMTKDVIELENGKRYPRDVIHHHGGVALVAKKDGKLLLVKQYRYAIQEETYELPAGKLEQGEDPYSCGLRELEEESGYTCEKMNLLFEMYSTPGFCTEKIIVYECERLRKVENPKAMDEDEDIEICWIDVKEAYEMVEKGMIKDAKTMLGIQHAYIHALCKKLEVLEKDL